MKVVHIITGLGDGGAHCGSICDGSFTTHMLTHWVRDRTRGEKLSLQWVIKAHCQDTARAVGLYDRGIIAPGYKADINVIDYTRRMNNLRWNGMKKKYINNIIRYDYKNKHLIKILKNILKNTSRTIK